MMSAQPSAFRRTALSFRHLMFPSVGGKFLCRKCVTLNKNRITLRFSFFSWTYVPRSFPLHINLSHQWDPTDSCAICCMLPLLQVLRTSANKVTTLTLVNEQAYINVSGVWRDSAISGIIRAIVREDSLFSSVPVWNCRYINSC
jgi:hypothetical protein